MVYGEQKAREMARSLLPSRGRKPARVVKAAIHRSARRQARMEAARLAREPEDFDGLPGPEGWPDKEIRDLVRCRRYADKVNPFIRWATAITRHLPPESRLSHVRGCLPQGVIGEHALSHLKHTEAFELPAERAWRQASWARWYQARRSERMDRGEHARLLRAVLKVPGGHRAFNQWMQRKHQPLAPPSPTRTLWGLHDVLPFLDAVGSFSRDEWGQHSRGLRPSHPEGFQRMEEFLQAFKRCRGDVEATWVALGVKPQRAWVARSSFTRRWAP